MALATRFGWVHEGRLLVDAARRPVAPFCAVNLHFPLAEEYKSLCIEKLAAIVQRACEGLPVVVAGDLNLFENKNGTAQRNALVAKGYIDAGAAQRTSLTDRAIPGTFVGFSSDPLYMSPLGDPALITSRLDHILLSRCHARGPHGWRLETAHATVHTDTKIPELDADPASELTQRDALPSDHLPVSIVASLVAQDRPADCGSPAEPAKPLFSEVECEETCAD